MRHDKDIRKSFDAGWLESFEINLSHDGKLDDLDVVLSAF